MAEKVTWKNIPITEALLEAILFESTVDAYYTDCAIALVSEALCEDHNICEYCCERRGEFFLPRLIAHIKEDRETALSR